MTAAETVSRTGAFWFGHGITYIDEDSFFLDPAVIFKSLVCLMPHNAVSEIQDAHSSRHKVQKYIGVSRDA